ncbi:reverse transcriptase [Caerostris extrusa]|uniref:Reverse transcriptase n=1 Tax=Caerostris extrusa TaxID=172846 RepID=A0AAV4TQG7_CAEEX|nr:reverse transcriptase [Caerostris extrusa]
MCRPFFQVARGLSTGVYISKFRCIDFLYRKGFRFGPPLRITTDKGTQFEAFIFWSLDKILRCGPSSNKPLPPRLKWPSREITELKLAIRSHSTSQWSTVLPTILLGFRAAWKEELQATKAKMLYGTPIRLPGKFLSPSSSTIDPRYLCRNCCH